MISAILLAGGKGKRMQSRLPKVLHKIAGKPLIFYPLKLLSQLPVNDIEVSIWYKKDTVKKAILEISKELKIKKKIGFSVQKAPLGTGDAVGTALKHIGLVSTVLVLYGDDSFLHKSETIKIVLSLHKKSENDITFVTLSVKDPSGMGRIVRDRHGKVLKIIEEKTANPNQLKIKEVNDGCYVFKTRWLRKFINQIPMSAVGEYYLTDLVEIGAKAGAKIDTYKLPDTSEWFGINTKEQLYEANQIMELNGKIG